MAADYEAYARRAALNASIMEALAAGVSDRALAIAADMGRASIHDVKNFVERRNGPSHEQNEEQLVHAVNAVFPCCHHALRFSRQQLDGPEEEFIRQCHKCKRKWRIRRQLITESPRGRVDQLFFELIEGPPLP